MFPHRLARLRAADLRALGDRHHLHLAGRAGAGGHEEAHRLFVGGAHGLRHHGHLRADHAGRRRRHLPDDLARHRLGRAVPLRRRHLRPHAHAARSRPMAGSSTACRSMPLVFMVFTLANVGLPGTSGFVGEFLTLIGTFRVNIRGGDARDDRRHPVGLLRALALPQGDLRQAGEAGACGASRDMGRREIADLCAAGRADASCSASIPSRCSTCRRRRSRQLLDNYQRGGRRRRRPPRWSRVRRRRSRMNSPFPALAARPARDRARARRDGAADARRLPRRAARRGRSTVLAVLLLVVAGRARRGRLPAGKIVTFGGSFVVDDFARVHEDPGADRLGRRDRACRSTISRPSSSRSSSSRPDPALDRSAC